MSEHTNVVFNNSCVTIPRNPATQLPSPLFERRPNMGTRTKSAQEGNVIKSLIEFYDSIPEYDDINHLSNKEFYRKLDGLKEMQRCFYECLQHEKSVDWLEGEGKRKGKGKKKVRANQGVSPQHSDDFSEKTKARTIKGSPRLSPQFSDDLSDMLQDFPLSSKSAPSSPRAVGWKEGGITIPKPFRMTVR